MSAPETTSAEAFWRYAGGECLFEGRGEAWRDIKAWITALPPAVDTLHIPAVSEPFLAWVTSGEVDFQEREGRGPWITNRIRKGSFFLTTGGAPYDVRWKAMTPEPYETMLVFIELPVLQRALEEVFGRDAPHVRLRDASAFDDEVLNSLLGVLREELMRREASPGFVEALARAIAIHLARAYGVADEEPHGSSPSLPGHKLRQITDWMAEHVAEEFSLDRLAAQAGLSKYHFQRLFKAATGVTPSHYQIDLRMNEARR